MDPRLVRSRALPIAAVVALVVAACAPGPSGSSTPGAGASVSPEPATSAMAVASPSRPPLALDGEELTACSLDSIPALCGSLSVPEDPATPTGRRIDLRVAVIPAVATDPEPDPVFMLAGGPGGSATDSFAWTPGTFRGVHATRDIVMVDQRGTGGSNAMWLPATPDVSGLSEAEAETVLRAWVDETLAGLDGDPRFYTTSIAMDDVDLVREALGYETINLFGPSYGATAAQYYIRQHEDRVRAVVLDGATLLDVPVFERIATSSQHALDVLFDRCAADPACAEAYPDLRAELAAVIRTVTEEPVTSSVLNPVTGTSLVIDAGSVAGAIHAALLDATTSASLPWLIHAAAADRWDDVARAILGASGGRPPEAYPIMSAEIRCWEAWAVYDPDEVARTGAGSYYLDVQLAAAREQAIGCRFAPPAIVPPNDAEPARSDVPVLFVVGEADPQDPPSNIADAPSDFPNSLTVVAPGHGHTVAHRGCLPAVVDAFIAAGTVEGLDTSCVADGMPLTPFRLP
jgi:pimeloyl-ACP methyl ester carboxylesterase